MTSKWISYIDLKKKKNFVLKWVKLCSILTLSAINTWRYTELNPLVNKLCQQLHLTINNIESTKMIRCSMGTMKAKPNNKHWKSNIRCHIIMVHRRISVWNSDIKKSFKLMEPKFTTNRCTQQIRRSKIKKMMRDKKLLNKFTCYFQTTINTKLSLTFYW